MQLKEFRTISNKLFSTFPTITIRKKIGFENHANFANNCNFLADICSSKNTNNTNQIIYLVANFQELIILRVVTVELASSCRAEYFTGMTTTPLELPLKFEAFKTAHCWQLVTGNLYWQFSCHHANGL